MITGATAVHINPILERCRQWARLMAEVKKLELVLIILHLNTSRPLVYAYKIS
jgi:hypothetical protein